MCGICGFVELDSAYYLTDREQRLAAMRDSIQHRGPDDIGAYFSPSGATLGAVRLSILDLAGGHQPLSNEDRSCWVALNGEIYNYPQLAQLLRQTGHHFVTHCDTEAVVHAYEEWGSACVEHLEGMFALAIWNEKDKRLFLARDRLGKKPLYYAATDRAFIFASEIKALLQHPACPTEIDRHALDMYLTLGYIPGPATIFAGIKKLLPGHWLTVESGQPLVISRYWDIPHSTAQPRRTFTLVEAASQLHDLLRQAVADRLLADVPLGVFLSGGLDSSVVTALMKQLQPDQLKSFSVRFREPEHDESSFSREVATTLGTDHYEIVADSCSPDLLLKLAWHCDEPLADPAIVPTFLVSELARQQVKVVLTGEGADELFAGYFYHALEQQAARFEWLPAGVRQSMLVPAAKAINTALQRHRYHPRTLWAWQLTPAQRVLAWTAVYTDADRVRWLTPDWMPAQNGVATYFQQLAEDYGSQDWLSRCLYLDAKIPLADGLLMKVDKMSMAASLEARCPFLDHRVVEFASQLPSSLKLQDGTNKLVLRQVAAKLLPGSIVGREKHGFSVPVKRWLMNDLRSLFWDLTSSGKFQGFNIIERDSLQRLWSQMEQDVPGSARQLWSLLMLAAWGATYS